MAPKTLILFLGKVKKCGIEGAMPYGVNSGIYVGVGQFDPPPCKIGLNGKTPVEFGTELNI